MGLFGGSETYVSSVVYNMAGDLIERPDYLKTTVASNVINNSRFSMSEALSTSYLTGPGIKLRAFHRWARRPGNYDTIGIGYSKVADESEMIPTVLADYIPVGSGDDVVVYDWEVETASVAKLALQYMYANYQSAAFLAWSASYNSTTNKITILREDGVTTHIFTPPHPLDGSLYLYVTYRLLHPGSTAVDLEMWVYKIGSGYPEIDEMVSVTDTSDEFLPFIPIRYKNNFISSTYKPEVYAQTKKAYKKLTGGQKIADLVEKIADNDDLEDIDHVYLVQAVSLTSVEPAAKKYLVHFFERMLNLSFSNQLLYEAYDDAWDTYNVEYEQWAFDKNEYLMDAEAGSTYPIPPPTAPPNVKPATSIKISTPGAFDTKLDMSVHWKVIKKTTGTGLGKPGAQPQEVWWGPITTVPWGWDDTEDQVTLWWQNSASTWVKYEIIGLKHRNEIYDEEAVKISARTAFEDDPEESGFIIPLHYDTLKSMSLVDSTQLAMSSSYLVFNCYKVVKQKWYQTGIFKIIVFVAMIAITVATGGAGAVGLLGAAGSVGASLGFTGLMATIVGAVANALAAMILMQVISWASVKLFGAKIGMIIATIASVAAMSIGTSMMNGMSMSAAWGQMMSATNLLSLTSAVGKGVAGYMQASAMEWAGKTQELQTEYEKASQALQQQWIDQFGLGTFAFDPNMLTANNPDGLTELPESFLQRTLMTGSDIADMSMGMLTDFADLTLDVGSINR